MQYTQSWPGADFTSSNISEKTSLNLWIQLLETVLNCRQSSGHCVCKSAWTPTCLCDLLVEPMSVNWTQVQACIHAEPMGCLRLDQALVASKPPFVNGM